jgi:hypothetical protein
MIFNNSDKAFSRKEPYELRHDAGMARKTLLKIRIADKTEPVTHT